MVRRFDGSSLRKVAASTVRLECMMDHSIVLQSWPVSSSHFSHQQIRFEESVFVKGDRQLDLQQLW